VFGSIRSRVSEPTLAQGYLPIAEIRYHHQTPVQSEGMVPIDQQRSDLPKVAEVYRLEAFASTDPMLADSAVVFVQFSLAQGVKGLITAQFDAETQVKLEGGKLTDGQGRIVALCDSNWRWERQALHASFGSTNSVVLAIPTKPLAA